MHFARRRIGRELLGRQRIVGAAHAAAGGGFASSWRLRVHELQVNRVVRFGLVPIGSATMASIRSMFYWVFLSFANAANGFGSPSSGRVSPRARFDRRARFQRHHRQSQYQFVLDHVGEADPAVRDQQWFVARRQCRLLVFSPIRPSRWSTRTASRYTSSVR